MTRKNPKSLAAMSVAAVFLATSGAALADNARVVKSSKDQVSLSISGQFSREMHLVDDGSSTRVRHQDSDYSSSRFRLEAGTQINPDLKVSGLAEIAIDDNRNTTSNVRGTSNGGRSGNDVQTRILDIAFEHAKFGTITMGAGDAAGSGVMTTNAHGIFNAEPSSSCLAVSDVQFRTDKDTFSGTSVCDALPDFDFSGRTTRIRYDTPEIMGFTASASHHDDQSYDLGLFYEGNIFDFDVAAAVGFTSALENGAAGTEIYGGMLSLVHSSGLGASGGCAYQNELANSSVAGAQDPVRCGVQLHYQRTFNSLGQTAFVGEWDQVDNAANDGDTAKAYAISVQQQVDAAGLEIWGKYTHYELSRDGSDLDDIDVFSLGTRLQF